MTLKVNSLAGFGGKPAAGAGGLFSPNAVASVWAWFEADSYVLADNTVITTDWIDQSPNGRNAIRLASPTLQTAELNGQSVIQSPNTSGFSLPAMNALTSGEYYIVQKMLAINTSGGHRFGNSGSTSHYPFSGDNIYDDFGSTTRKDSIVTNATLTNWHVTYGWSAPSDWAMFQNTSGVAIRSTGTNTVGFTATPKLLENGTQGMNAQIAAAYFFSAKLSSGDRASMKSRITAKYGLAFA